MKDIQVKEIEGIELAVDFDGDLSGLSYTTTTSASGGTLTLESFQKAVDYLASDEYHQKEIERQKAWLKGSEIINAAVDQKIITPEEHLMLSMSLSINGMLLVSSKMYKRLEKVKLSQPPNKDTHE